MLSVEVTSENNNGYLHLEWFRIDNRCPFLIEVLTAIIDRTSGAMTSSLITTGQYEFLYRIAYYGLITQGRG